MQRTRPVPRSRTWSSFACSLPTGRHLRGGLVAVGLSFLAFACDGDRPTAADVSKVPTKPSFIPGDDPNAPAFNNSDACMADDVAEFAGGPVNCTAQDAPVANVTVTSINGDPFTGQPFVCTSQTVSLGLTATLTSNSQSVRGDMGVWVATDGGNALTGQCNHYIVPPGTPNSFNADNDSCAGIVASIDGQPVSVQFNLGVLTVPCVDNDNNGFIDLNGCLAWTVPGQEGDATCPDNADGIAPAGTADDYRAATIPGTPAKCKCNSFTVPVIIPKFATLEIVKTCSPSNDNGTFDLEIDDVVKKDDATCDGVASPANTTGAVQVGAGTNASPGADHTFAESGFTFANYTSSLVSCTDNGAAMAAPAPGAYSPDANLSIHVVPEHAYVCTFLNTRKGSLTIVKDDQNPATDPQDFHFGVTGTGLSAFDLDDDGDNANTLSNTKTFSNLTSGSYTVAEDAVTGWDLTSISCTGGGANTSTNVGTRTATIGLDAGENITCTFVNQQRPNVTIVKDVQNPATDPEDFHFGTTGSGLGPFDLDDDADPTLSANQVFNSVPVGTKTVTEDAEANFDLTSISCSGGGANTSTNVGTRTASIGADYGENITCTFVNQRKARLQVQKLFPSNPALVFSFNRNYPGGLGFTLTDGQINDSGFSLAPGTYRVCELDNAVSFSATATLDGAPVALFNPNATDQPPQDLGNRCVDVVLAYGSDRIVVFTNTPPPGGDARTIGYWKNWSSCANSNGKQYQKALAPGGVGFGKTLDGNLPQLVGNLNVNTCPIAVSILSKQDVVTGKNMASDPLYGLAAQYLAALLNYSSGAQQCSNVTTAMGQAQALLVKYNFTGTGAYKKSMTASDQSLANSLAATLDSYNNNTLVCQP
jgi:prealbumin domain-containing protein